MESNTEQWFTESSKDFLLAEYQALREEILKRIEMVHQLLAGALVAWVAILGIAFQNSTNSQSNIERILLAYPVLATAVAFLWAFNNESIMLIGSFLKVMGDEVQHLGGGLRWENYLRDPRIKGTVGNTRADWHLHSGVLSTIAIFVITELLTLVAGILRDSAFFLRIGTVAYFAVCIAITTWVIWRSERNIASPSPREFRPRSV